MRFVLVHGAFHGAWSWQHLITELEAAGHTVTAIDLPGAGDDTTPLAEVTLDAYADKVRAALGADGPPPVLVGHSMGGTVAIQSSP